jgi:NADH-quinone oxidoreductase subunit M
MSILLVLTVFLPLAGSVALFLSPQLNYRTARRVALGTVLATLAFTLVMLAAFQTGTEAPQFTYAGSGGGYGWGWLESPNIRFALGLDGISIWLFALTAILMITSVCCSWESVQEKAPAHYGLMLALATGLLGLFASLDIVLFYIFFEFTLIPLFFLIGIYGGPERRRASITFFLYTLAGSLLTLLGVILLVVVNYRFSRSHVLTFSIPELTQGLAAIARDGLWPEWNQASWSSPQVLIFLLLFAGFAIKVPLFPFHTWLPLAHVEAPTAGSVLLAGVLLKVGSYGFVRFSLAMTPLGAQALFGMLATISVIGIIYGALTALAQKDVKKLVAYSSVGHMGFVALGMFSFTATGLDGSVMQMINHGVTTGALFACVGIFYERYHTRDVDELSGLWARLPLLAFFFILSALGSAALPGLNGFVGEFPILVGMFSRHATAAVLGAIGMILGPYYLLWMLERVIFGPLREPEEPGHHAHAIRKVGWHEVLGLAPLMVLIVAIGVYPAPIFERMRPALAPIAARLEAASKVLEKERAVLEKARALVRETKTPAPALVSMKGPRP